MDALQASSILLWPASRGVDLRNKCWQAVTVWIAMHNAWSERDPEKCPKEALPE